MSINIEVIAELDDTVSTAVENYISAVYPWLPTRMDFSKIPNHTHIKWGKATDEEVEEFILASSLSIYNYCAVLYSPDKPMKIFSLDYLSKEIDLISSNKQIFIVFGASKNNNNWKVDKVHILPHHEHPFWLMVNTDSGGS